MFIHKVYHISSFLIIILALLKIIYLKNDTQKYQTILSPNSPFMRQYDYNSLYHKTIHPKVSVLIPIYNRANMFLTALRSVQNQQFSDLEIVLVDDGSSDNSYDLMKQESKKDPRITLVKHERNKGLFQSRISGLLESKGEYILFLDSDDAYCDDNVLNILYSTAEREQADIVHFSVLSGKLDNLYLFDKASPLKRTVLNAPEFYNIEVKNGKNPFNWNKLIRRSVAIKAFKSLGEERMKIPIYRLQDHLINYLIMRAAKRYVAIKDILLWYNFNSESVTLKHYKEKDYIGIYYMVQWMSELSEKTEEGYLELNYLIESSISKWKRDGKNWDRDVNEKLIEMSKKMMSNPYTSEANRRLLRWLKETCGDRS